jgi:O-antigen/teichoic acid export membrane protein
MAGALTYALLNFLLLLVLTRGIGPAGTGALLSAVALFTILSATAVLGTDTGLIRFIPRFRALGRRGDIRPALTGALVPAMVSAVLLGLALHSAAPVLVRLFYAEGDAGSVVAYTRVLAPFLPLAVLSIILLAATRGFGTMLPTFVLDKVTRPALQPALVLIAVAAGGGALAVGIAWGAPFAMVLLPASWWLRSLLRADERGGLPVQEPSPRGAVLREFWRYTLPRTFASIFRVVIQWLDVMLVGAMSSLRDAGIYAAATRLLALATFASLAIGQAVQPMMSELLSSDDRERARAVFATSTAWLVCLAWPVYLAAAIFAPILLQVFGRDFREGAVVVVILGLARLVASGAGPVDMVLLMGGKSSLSFANTVVALTVNVVLNLLLIPRIGITGAALAWAASSLINNLLPLAQVHHHLGIHPFGRPLVTAMTGALVCFGGLGLAARAAFEGSILAAGASLAVSSAAYACFLAWRRHDLALPAMWTSLARRRKGTRRADVPAPRAVVQ